MQLVGDIRLDYTIQGTGDHILCLPSKFEPDSTSRTSEFRLEPIPVSFGVYLPGFALSDYKIVTW